MVMEKRFGVAALAIGMGLAATVPAAAEIFQFLATPHVGLNRIYRVDSTTGEMGACQYGLKDGTVGVTLCYPAGDGAGPRPRRPLRAAGGRRRAAAAAEERPACLSSRPRTWSSCAT